MTSEFSPIQILLVEDSPSDCLLALEALTRAKLVSRVSVAEDGVKALSFLRRLEGYADAPRPDLILLDLNLPRKDGREVLAEIKTDPALSTIPVIVLTSSLARADIVQAYALHANCYIPKPLDFASFTKVIAAIEHFWLGVAMLPPSSARQLTAGRDPSL